MHYSDAQLRTLLGDESAQPDIEARLSHLDDCETCQRRLAELSGEGEWLSDVIESIANETCELDDVPPSSCSVVLCTSPSELADDGLRCDSVRLDFLDAPRHPELLGRLGRYDIERLIGIGGFGVVFKAHDSELHRAVAIKVLAPHLMSSAAARRRFAREAQASAAIVHDHVVPIHDVVSDPKKCYFVMQYIAGGSLQQRVDRRGPLPTEDVLRIASQMAAGLEAAHEQGVVHRDVKPGNILLEESVDRVLISDFGLARTADDGNLTRSGAVTGTPHYMSPEQAHGEPIDPRSDLFCLGSVIYFMCTGHSPFRAPRIMAVLNRVCNEAHRPLGDIDPAIPIELEELVDQLLSKSPDDRPATATATRQRLNQILADLQSGRTRPRRAARTGSRTRWLAAVASIAVLTLLAGSIWLINWKQPEAPPAAELAESAEPAAPTAAQQTYLPPSTTNVHSSVATYPPDPFLATLVETEQLLNEYELRQPWASTLYQGDSWDDEAATVIRALEQMKDELGIELQSPEPGIPFTSEHQGDSP